MHLFKQLFPTLLIPLIFLGAGCTGTSPEPEPVTQEENTQADSARELPLEDGTYTLALETSTINWSGSKRIGTTHTGTVQAKDGSLLVQDSQFVSGTVVVDMTTIENDDLTDVEKEQQLEGHLKSDDFFGVESYPTATFTLSEIVEVITVDTTHEVKGTMTIKGIENEVTFPATLERTQEGLRVTGTLTLDRTLWDVRYGSGKFFEDLGDTLIEDEFILNLDLTFVAP